MTKPVAIATLLAITGVFYSVHAQDQPKTDRSSERIEGKREVPENKAIQFGGFVAIAQELQSVREAHRVSIETFVEMSQDSETIILDTRSKAAFDLVHMAGATHLNFSDFTEPKLKKVIPSKETRILIYCNNNFKAPVVTDATTDAEKETPKEDGNERIVEGFTNKAPTLALNIPTFINLHGYGYKNVYELADYLDLGDPRLKLAGTAVKSARITTAKSQPSSPTSFDPRR